MLKRYRFDSDSKVGVEKGFLRRIFHTYSPTGSFLLASLNATCSYFRCLACIARQEGVPTLWYQNIRHACSMVGMRPGSFKKYFRKFFINMLWQLKGYNHIF